jgi:hypothetical protein
MRQFVTLKTQISRKNIAKRKRPKIADMRKIPNRRTTDIHLYFVAAERMKIFDLVC